MDLLNRLAVPMMPAQLCETIAESSQGDVLEDDCIGDEEAAEATMRQAFHDFGVNRLAKLEENQLALSCFFLNQHN